MEFDVEREEGQYHVREKGQVSRGTTLTDVWLQQMGFWPLSRLNIEHAVMAAAYAMSGGVLDTHAARRVPKDMDFTPSFNSYASTPSRGRLPRNPEGIANTQRKKPERPRIPDRMMFRSS